MKDYVERIKDDLALFGSEQATITVSRKDLEKLVNAYEKKVNKEQVRDKWDRECAGLER